MVDDRDAGPFGIDMISEVSAMTDSGTEADSSGDCSDHARVKGNRHAASQKVDAISLNVTNVTKRSPELFLIQSIFVCKEEAGSLKSGRRLSK